MLALGRALMGKPKLLLLDEPSLGLAPLIVREIFRIVVELRELGVSILLVEQNARAALETADYRLCAGDRLDRAERQGQRSDPRSARDRQLSRRQGGVRWKTRDALKAKWSGLFAPAERTLPAMLTRQAERYGQKPLVSAADVTWTYADARDAAARFADTLRGAGVKAGRPRRFDLLEPARVPAGRARLRLARRGGGADQRRLAGAAASAHPRQTAGRSCSSSKPPMPRTSTCWSPTSSRSKRSG